VERSIEFYNETKLKTTGIGQVPEDWTVDRVDELCETPEYGYTQSASEKPVGPKFLRITDIQDGKVDWTQVPYCECPDSLIENYLLRPCDILFARTGATTGKSYLVRESPKCVFASYLIRVRPKRRIDPDFLFHFFNSSVYWKQVRRHMSGSAQGGMNASLLSSVLVQVPSLGEQKRIATVLASFERVIQETDEIMTNLHQLKRGLMRRLLDEGIGHVRFEKTSIGKIPEEWSISTVGKECQVGTGGTPRRNNPNYFQGDIPWVKSTEIDYNTIQDTEEHITKEALTETSARLYPAGTLLIAMYGQGVTRGKCAILAVDAAVNQACAAVLPSSRIRIPFLFYWCQMNYHKLRALGQGANQANFNLSLVRSAKIPVPSVDEQDKIASILASFDKDIQREKQTKTQFEKAKKWFMQNLLSGKIRTKMNVVS
jgi:type I restriction enzyme S subunit